MKKIKFFLLLSTFYFLFSFPLVVQSATLYLLPQSQTIQKGDSFLLEVRINTENEEINAVESYLNFPSEALEVIDFIKGNSILNIFLKTPAVKNDEISVIGGIPNGFRGDGLLIKIIFLAKELSKFNLNFKENSKVLLNDGIGTPVELNFLEGSYEIIEKSGNLPVISSPTHPDQNKWSKSNTIRLHWDLIEKVQYSYLLSQDPLAEPDEIADKPAGELIWMGDMEYPNLEDGIYYFSLRQKLPAENWSKTIRYRAMIDTLPPEEFEPKIAKATDVFSGKYFLSFSTFDRTSGVDHYEILEKKKPETWKVGESPYLLEDQSLRGKILVKAIDKAGNERIAEVFPPPKPFPWWLIILILIGVIWWLWKKFKRKTENNPLKDTNIK